MTEIQYLTVLNDLLNVLSTTHTNISVVSNCNLMS